MRRLGLILLLPLVWVPIIGLLAVLVPALPWWSWLVALILAWRIRRLRRSVTDPGPLDPGSPRYSPTGLGGF